MVTHIDDSVASVIAATEQQGLRENTLVVWMSDNGGTPGGGGDNSPLLGGNGSPYEGGTCVPALVNWPGRIEPGVLSQQMSALDWLPTLLSATGVSATVAKPFDGFDMWPVIAGGESVERGDLVLGSRFGRALFRGKWKYVETVPGWLGLGASEGGPRRRPGTRPGGGARAGQGGSAQRSQQALFDVNADPAESSNLAAGHPQLLRELAAAARAIGADVPMMSRGFQLRDGGTFVRVGPLEAFPQDRGAHVIDRVDE